MGLPFLALRKIAFDCANLSSHDPPTVSLSLCVARLKRDGRYIFEPWMKPVEMKRYPRKTSKGGFVDPVKTNVSRAMMLQQKMALGCAPRCAAVLKRMTASAPWLLPNSIPMLVCQDSKLACGNIDKHAHKHSQSASQAGSREAVRPSVHPSQSVSQSDTRHGHGAICPRTCCVLNLLLSERTSFFASSVFM